MIVATRTSTRQARALPPLVAIVGPTAVGKTATAIRLALDIDGEVVSADSRYLYRGMDIGTAKPTVAEMRGVPHHLIDVVDPTEDYSLALYQHDAYQAIADITARGRVPILAGGTPLYINAVLEGWRIPEVPPDPAFREEMEQVARERGPEHLHQRLAAVDPAAAARIPATNVRRVIRALEIYHHTGRPMTELEGKSPPPYRVLIVGLTLPREELYRRIDRRVDEQIAAGLVDEVRGLLEAGVPPDAPAMSAIGYGEIVAYLQGETTLPEAIERIRYNTHRYARHQTTWLRRMRGVHWFDPREPGWYERLLTLVRTFLAGNETDLNSADVD
ncbi:MAG: tRNA (adenosine(37)-N6)-dimethylallyltransferase MiaA [Sphaerobacter thermophilus]|uniref:tRNA dimethylallyltransferase n=1 Tax=Sphaerobacter thermophilus (strain ATCC 49802 / DSM 20745 / KCCM 41009 / NCIMB 13125 / S 6022) TaxID=479434 RepID=D1CA21_SPHTD|nr:tRNA (adenosine(37)-N6)-dimethylallyltransferase MiaA [Sphaerobacter thermophilus]ACZ40664.1 tRNA delta(2)-isopentenylpyrophosphate transferase [Sphaerobacter thermophilus DSM 20745]